MANAKQKITHITILSQILLNRLHDHVANNNFSKGLKYSAAKFINQLSVVERERYDKFFEHDESASQIIYSGMDRFYEKVSQIEIEKMDSAGQLLDMLIHYPEDLERVLNQLLIEKENQDGNN